MVKRGITKKPELQSLLLKWYEEASSNYRAIGSQKVQLISSSIFGLGLLITFATLFYYLLKDNLLVDFRAAWFLGILLFLIIVLFVGVGWYFLFLHKVQRVNTITTLLLEKLLKELISGEKDEEQIMNESYEFIPQLRVADRLKVREKRWFKKSLQTDAEKELIEYLS